MTDTPGTSLRQATEADAPRIAALFTEEGYPVTPSVVAARLARFDGDGSRVIVADAETTTYLSRREVQLSLDEDLQAAKPRLANAVVCSSACPVPNRNERFSLGLTRWVSC